MLNAERGMQNEEKDFPFSFCIPRSSFRVSYCPRRSGFKSANSGAKNPILADQNIIKPNLPTPIIAPLNVHHIPVNLRLIPIPIRVIRLPRREMEAPGDLLIEQNIFHRLGDDRIKRDRKLPDVARPLVRVENIVHLVRQPGRVH